MRRKRASAGFAVILTAGILAVALSAGCTAPTSGSGHAANDNKQAASSPAAPSTGPADQGNSNSSSGVQVVVDNFAFKPAVLTVKPGTLVTWVR